MRRLQRRAAFASLALEKVRRLSPERGFGKFRALDSRERREKLHASLLSFRAQSSPQAWLYTLTLFWPQSHHAAGGHPPLEPLAHQQHGWKEPVSSWDLH